MLRHWGALQSRTSAENGTEDATVSYADITKMRCNVETLNGIQSIKNRGSDRTPTHRIEFRRVPDLSRGNYILILNGPYAGQRFKIDDNAMQRLGRRMFLTAYTVGTNDAFSQPETPTLPDIFS